MEISMPQPIQLHDVVALLVDLNEHGLRRGQVGTVVESLDRDVFEVEFSDDDGRTYATLAVRSDQMMVLHYHSIPLPFLCCRGVGMLLPQDKHSAAAG
jgi:hypothetical protein